MGAMAADRYSLSQKALHWITAVLVLCLVLTGLAYLYEWADEGVIDWHQIAGQILIIVVVFRIIARLRRRVPHNPAHARWERGLAAGVHLLLYALLIAFVVTGYVSASALKDNALLLPVDIGFARSDLGEQFLEAHYALKWALLAVLGLHLAGVVKHVVIDRDTTFSSIWFSKNRDKQ